MEKKAISKSRHRRAASLPGKTGLVLTAGGARGAYQAGVLKRIGRIKALRNRPSPFQIISGASAGAINGAAIASYSLDFAQGCARLATLWGQLNVRKVFRTDSIALTRTAARMALDMGLGGMIGAGRVDALVDAAPLRAFLGQHLDFTGIGTAIQRGPLYALAITATGYHSGKAFTFIQGRPGHPLWHKSRRVALPTELTVDHVCASAAIPIVFPPVPLTVNESTAFFGDGALRLATPLSPAIRLGADRVFAVGVRCSNVSDALLQAELSADGSSREPVSLRRPPLSQICGVFMNAIFLDHLDADLDHLKRMNELVAAYHTPIRDPLPPLDHEPMRVIRPLMVAPSEDIAMIARTHEHRMPRSIRYVMDGLGTPEAQSADLMSYLLFDSAFTRELVDLGYRDAGRRIDEIESFLLAA